jgi:ribosomal protein S12 methylthiotransferase
VAECGALLERGIRELCLVGQDLASYGRDLSRDGGAVRCLLPDLLEAVARLQGSFWVRLLYLHPDHFPLPILDLMRRDDRFLPYFDIPFQHASAPVLATMNRRGSALAYLALLEDIRAALPDAVIRSTLMTGFPGETDADFRAALDFVEAARLDWLGVFAYSREEDTPAYSMQARPTKRLAAERKTTIEERQTRITGERMERFVGRTVPALVEEAVDEEDGLYLGRLFCHAPEVDGAAVIESGVPLIPGDFVTVKVTARAGFDLSCCPYGS